MPSPDRQSAGPKPRSAAGRRCTPPSARKSRRDEVRVRIEQQTRRVQERRSPDSRTRRGNCALPASVTGPSSGVRKRSVRANFAQRRAHLILKRSREIGQAVDRAGEFGLRLPGGHARGIDLARDFSPRPAPGSYPAAPAGRPPQWKSAGAIENWPAIPRAAPGHNRTARADCALARRTACSPGPQSRNCHPAG